jgi:parallel beta-helix repeat protein
MTATSPVANNIITKNNISSNGYGFIFYEAGSGNKIYLNDVVGSAVTATTFGSTPPSVTYWNSTEPIEYTYNGTTYTDYLGNYWSDYSGADGDGNGIGDTSHVLPESLGVDYRPLMAKFENYPAPAPPVTPTPMPLPVSSGVSLGATIRPAISLVVAPDALDFGELAAGQTSGAHTLTLSNTGGYGISVTAEVNDTASNLFVNGVLLDSNAWSAYSASIASGGSKPAGASLKVPGDYAGVGAKEGTLVFWAEMS